MFKTGKDIAKTPPGPLKKGVSKTGTTFASTAAVKRRITYKQITLLLGIIAMLIAIALWVKDPVKQSHSRTPAFPLETPALKANSLIQTVAEVIF